MTDLEAIRELAAREERERHEAERAAREAVRQEALLNAPLSYGPIDWTRFTSTSQMSAREFSVWCDLSPRPRLGPPPAPPAPLKREVQFSEELMLQLAEANGRAMAKVIARERARTDEKLAGLQLELERVRGELGEIRAELTIDRSLANPPRRRSTTARRGSSPQH